MIHSPAFELLRKYYPCEQETQDFVMKRIGKTHSQNELLAIFENGVAGQYGKVYKADPQTIIGWVDEYRKTLKTGNNYLATGLMEATVKITDKRYPSSLIDWQQEVNKCYNAHSRGVSEEFFPPDVYDRLVLDGKLKSGAMRENLIYDQYDKAKQITVRLYFIRCQMAGFQSIYPV